MNLTLYIIFKLLIISTIRCSKVTHYSIQKHKSTSRVKGKSTNDFNVDGLNAYSCPNYDTDIRGFACWGLNTAYNVKKNSWQECANQCHYSKYTVLGNCEKFVFNANNGVCYIKNGDNRCSKYEANNILSSKSSYMIGECATTCKVSNWSTWTPCSGVCGEMRSRSRSIISKPKYSQDYCPNLIEYSNCNVKESCPENCPQYGISIIGWGCQFESTFNYNKNLFVSYEHNWKNCLSTCKQDPLCVSWSFNATLSEGPNSSDTIEYRPCYTHRFASGCQALAPGWVSGNRNTREQDCDTGSCIYNEWSAWSICKEPCSNTEMRKRSRTVKSVNLNWSSTPCKNEDQYQVCSESEESISNCKTCLVSQWSSWSECSTSCNKGSKIRTREVIKYPENGDNSNCPELIEESTCNEDVECPNKSECVVGEWSSWSPCSVSCGSGESTRNREVVGENCEESTIDTQACNIASCDDKVSHCSAIMSVWSSWSECSEKCGNGVIRRYRDFDFSKIDIFGFNPPGTKDEQNQVREICKDVITIQEESCTSGIICTPGCTYGEWNNWSDCDCTGTQSRSRVVNFPEGIIDAICQSGNDTRNCVKPEGCQETAPDPSNTELALAIGVPVGLLGLCVVVGSLFLIGGRNSEEEDETNYEYLEQEDSVAFAEDSEYVQDVGPESQNWVN